MYPGRYDTLVTVSAVTSTDQLASFSNYGSEVDICAPGDAVMTFTVGGRVISQSGTSFAAPYVAGVLALLLSASPGLAPDRAVEILEATAADLGVRGQDSRFGCGIVDAWAAVMAAAGR
jgi:serine protease